jgi:hypothetical protein
VTSPSQSPFGKRAFVINAGTAIGVYIAFRFSGVKLPIILAVRIAVFTFALINLMLLVVAPRLKALKMVGTAAPNLWRVAFQVLAERPFIIALLILQLLGVSRATATAIVLIQTSLSDYVRGMPNAHSMTLRLMGASVLMVGVAFCWLLGAIGIWPSRPWAWWLVLVLNGLSATVSGVLQILKLDAFLLDPLAMLAVMLLLVRSVRKEFRGGQTTVKEVAG